MIYLFLFKKATQRILSDSGLLTKIKSRYKNHFKKATICHLFAAPRGHVTTIYDVFGQELALSYNFQQQTPPLIGD